MWRRMMQLRPTSCPAPSGWIVSVSTTCCPSALEAEAAPLPDRTTSDLRFIFFLHRRGGRRGKGCCAPLKLPLCHHQELQIQRSRFVQILKNFLSKPYP